MISLVCDNCGKKFDRSWVDYKDETPELCDECRENPPEPPRE